MHFHLSTEDHERVNAWLAKDIYPVWVEFQQQNNPEAAVHHFTSKGITYPYFGAIGGGVTYEFTPTGLGVITIVTHRMPDGSKAELNLTNFDEW